MKKARLSAFHAFIVICSIAMPSRSTIADPMISAGRPADTSAKTLSEIRAAERRRIPLEVYLKSSTHQKAGGPVEVTVIITNLFPASILLNSRMLVNHPKLEGEIAFRILDKAGQPLEIQSLVTPLTMREDDFVILARGESVQRTVDLSDLYGMRRKGEYKVQAYYHNEVDFVAQGKRAWKGRVWSDPVDIELVR